MILAKAHEEQARILNEAVATRERILKEAKTFRLCIRQELYCHLRIFFYSSQFQYR